MLASAPAIPRRAFLVAVAVLVANDWVLKGAGVLPGWLTGKLSDVAGMVVAPVVLAALLALAGLPVRHARRAAVAVIGLGFAAIKLSPAAAGLFDDAVNGVTRLLGLPIAAQTVPDRLDLLALPFLVVGSALAERLAPDPALRRSGALALGLLACAATSPAYARLDPHWHFADPEDAGLWGARLENGAIVVQFGRQSKDGAFEIGIELAGREGPLALDLADVAIQAPGERIPAQNPGQEPATLSVDADETDAVRWIFRPQGPPWPRGAKGTLEIAILDGARRRTLRADLTFEERIVTWRRAGLR